jgi:uncharacterized membrane protein
MVNRAFDKVRQAARGMPAVIIRMIDALSHVAENSTTDRQREVLARQAEMIWRSAEADVAEPNDLDDIRHRFERFVAVCEETARIQRGVGPEGVGEP